MEAFAIMEMKKLNGETRLGQPILQRKLSCAGIRPQDFP